MFLVWLIPVVNVALGVVTLLDGLSSSKDVDDNKILKWFRGDDWD